MQQCKSFLYDAIENKDSLITTKSATIELLLWNVGSSEEANTRAALTGSIDRT